LNRIVHRDLCFFDDATICSKRKGRNKIKLAYHDDDRREGGWLLIAQVVRRTRRTVIRPRSYHQLPRDLLTLGAGLRRGERNHGLALWRRGKTPAPPVLRQAPPTTPTPAEQEPAKSRVSLLPLPACSGQRRPSHESKTATRKNKRHANGVATSCSWLQFHGTLATRL
jgi:hypothetical protein